MKFTLIAIVGLSLGYVLGSFTANRGKTSHSTDPPATVLPVTRLPIPDYLREARTLIVAYTLGVHAREAASLTLTPETAARLGDALATDLAARPVTGRNSFVAHFEIGLLGPSGVRKISYDSTAGAARISVEGHGDELLAGSSFGDELIRLLGQQTAAEGSR